MKVYITGGTAEENEILKAFCQKRGWTVKVTHRIGRGREKYRPDNDLRGLGPILGLLSQPYIPIGLNNLGQS